MLISIDTYADIDERKLMDVYGESNAENAPRAFFCGGGGEKST